MTSPTIVKPGDPSFYREAQYESKPHGAIIVDGQEVASTLQCPHCNMHFVSMKGSGIRRAWCPCCNAVTCGNPACDPCRPWEKQMEAIEKTDKVLVERLGNLLS